MANEKNLKNLKDRTPEERKAIAKKGQEAGCKVKREKKIMTEIITAYLLKKNKAESIEQMYDKVIQRADSASVALVKEFRDAAEGQTVVHANDPENPIVINIIPVG